MLTRAEAEAIVRAELARQPRRGGARRLPRTWRGNVQINRRAASLLGIRSLSSFVDYVLANLGGGGGGGGGSEPDPACPPCVGPASYTYDASGRLTQIDYGSPVSVVSVITRDADGRITQVATTWDAGTRTCTYGYDGNGRRSTSSCAFVAA
ncbi:MAG: hypothetical protein ACE37F_14170 [Nannocystaceae bacterium]|nr:hypothetical protein [bacterium]